MITPATVLVVGSGGREHALVSSLASSDKVKQVFACPGNGGTNGISKCSNLECPNVSDVDFIVNLAQENDVDMVVIGPEVPLVNGLTDALQKENILCYKQE